MVTRLGALACMILMHAPASLLPPSCCAAPALPSGRLGTAPPVDDAAALLRRRGAAPPHSVGRRLAVCHPPAPGATSSPRGRRACRTRSSACAAASGGFGAAPSSEPAPLHTRCAFQSPSLPAAATAARRRRSGLFLAVAAGNSAHGAERTQPRRFLCVAAAPPARCDRQCGYVRSGSEQWSERARGAPKEPTPATPRFQGVPHRLGTAPRA